MYEYWRNIVFKLNEVTNANFLLILNDNVLCLTTLPVMSAHA
jgi:hypothetical protein